MKVMAEEMRKGTESVNPAKLGESIEQLSGFRMFENPFNVDQIELEALKTRVKNLEREV